MNTSQSVEQHLESDDSAIQTGITFLRTLFGEGDVVLFRPIETWTEANKKRSRVIYKSLIYCAADPMLWLNALRQLCKMAETEHANIFFGACPRVGDKGRFDLAWQIRIVRALWCDIDHVTVADALGRVVKAGLPRPTIVVSSGSGVHLYWLLEEPYLIDDVGAPLPVETEWTPASDGGKKPRKYIIENSDKVYLDQPRQISRLSPKAKHIQDVLAGIAKAIGGDHTTDLARLLRVPGTFNRKDQRNGKAPVLTTLVECERARRYSLVTFEPWKITSAETAKRQQIATMPLRKPHKASPDQADKLSDYIAAASSAAKGSRSEADFAVCCYAVRHGIAKDEVWQQVQQIGKFAEQGQRYFDVTWGNAEFDVHTDQLETQRESKKPKEPARRDEGQLPCEQDFDATTGEFAGQDDHSEDTTIVVDPTVTPVAATLQQLTDRLLAAGGCYARCDQLVVIDDEKIIPILLPPELAGLLNQHAEFVLVGPKTRQFCPLPTNYANTWLYQRKERRRFAEIKLYTRNPVFANDWRLVESGLDSHSGIYYAGPRVPIRNGTQHLDVLLREFCFKSPADRTNYIAMLLTIVLIPLFIGSKPAVLFNGNQPGLGKSILAQLISILRDGHPTETATYNPNDEEFEKRLGAIVRRGATTIIIDNAKGNSRNARIESPCLERSITDPILSYRLLGKSLEIRAENSHIFCITANTPDVSRDLVTRSVVVNLYHEGDPARRTFAINDPESYAEQHRMELLGELLGMVERWKEQGKRMANTQSRFNKRNWGNIVGGILDAAGEPDFLANAEEAAAQLDEVRRDFAELTAVLVDSPQGIWTASELVSVCQQHRLLVGHLIEGSPRSLATKMGTLAGRFIAESFALTDGREAVFHRTSDRKGNIYRVEVRKSAEP